MTNLNTSIPGTKPIDPKTGLHKTNSDKEALLQNILNGSLILGTILFFLNIYNAFQRNDYVSVGLIFAAYSIIFLVTFWRMIPFQIRVGALTLAYFLAGVMSLIQSGVNANALLYFLISVIILAILEEKNYWLVLVAASALVVSLISYLFQTEIVVIGASLAPVNSILYWISIIVNFIFLMILIAAPLSQYVRRTRSSIEEISKSNTSLLQENQELKQNRVDFENNLDRRRLRLVTTRQITREISHQTDLDKLMHDSVDLVRTQLGYHYVAIFLNDVRDENSLLTSASGEGSQALLDRKYRIRIHEPGIISSVVSQGEAHIANDLTLEPAQNKSSQISNSLSEITVPLRVGQHVIGALDVQSDQKNAFGDEDLEMLQSIADQLAVVIDKTTLIQKLNSDVESLEENYRSYTSGVWRTHLKGTKGHLNYTFIENKLETDFIQTKIAEQALNSGQTVIAPANTDNNPEVNESIIAVPIILRDQVLGVLNIKYKGTDIPNDMTALVSNASDRLALALENARLLEQIQERADREHLVGEISSKLRAATDIDSILQTTAAELGKSLGIDEVRIQLKTADSR
ncbi:MAG: GAF domain-containing protein [Anaerolineaceae bacterium]